MSSRNSSPTEVDWEKLDKRKFIVVGAGMFSGVTTCLFPLTVIKTRQMAIPGAPTGLLAARHAVRNILATEGVPGLYRGFGTVVLGAIPARVVYLTTLEAMKSASSNFANSISSNEAQAAGVANFIAGATASLLTQSIIVPVDVVSQRLMVHDRPPSPAPPPQRSSSASQSNSQLNRQARSVSTASFAPGRQNGFALARLIVQQEGIRGLYRGFGASVATFVPSSAMWWSAYGAYQKTIWNQYEQLTGNNASGSLQTRSPKEVLAVQTLSALLAGCTSAVLTNPLDVVKTRLQVASRLQGGPTPSFLGVARQLIAEEGSKGLLRGVAPRVASTGMWGTAMVTTYEFLKRISVKPEFLQS